MIELRGVALQFELLVGIGFDRLKALHGFLYDDVGLGELILSGFHEFTDVSSEKHSEDNHGGDGDEHDEGQFFHRHEDDDYPTDEDNNLADEFSEGEGNDALYLSDIAGHAAGDFANAAGFEEGDAEGNEFFVEVAPKQGHTFFADYGEELNPKVGEDALNTQEDEEQEENAVEGKAVSRLAADDVENFAR